MHKLLISSHLLASFIFIFHLYFLLLPSVNVLFTFFVLIYLLKLGGEHILYGYSRNAALHQSSV